MAFIRACLSRVILKGITSMSVVKESKREGEKEAPLYGLVLINPEFYWQCFDHYLC